MRHISLGSSGLSSLPLQLLVLLISTCVWLPAGKIEYSSSIIIQGADCMLILYKGTKCIHIGNFHHLPDSQSLCCQGGGKFPTLLEFFCLVS